MIARTQTGLSWQPSPGQDRIASLLVDQVTPGIKPRHTRAIACVLWTASACCLRSMTGPAAPDAADSGMR